MSLIDFLNNNKTKIVGVTGVIVGTLQASGQLQQLLDEVAYGWVSIILGVLTAVCGFLNSSTTTK